MIGGCVEKHEVAVLERRSQTVFVGVAKLIVSPSLVCVCFCRLLVCQMVGGGRISCFRINDCQE